MTNIVVYIQYIFNSEISKTEESRYLDASCHKINSLKCPSQQKLESSLEFIVILNFTQHNIIIILYDKADQLYKLILINYNIILKL